MSAFSAALARDVQKSKKDKRLESKKKKALAFLKLIHGGQDGADRNSEIGTPVPAKKVRLDDGGRSWETQSGSSAETGDSQNCSSGSVDEEYARAKRLQRARQKQLEEERERTRQKSLKYGPKINLSLRNMVPFNKFDENVSKEKLEESLPPLFIADLQHLMLLALLKNFSFWTPRWCRLTRPGKLSSVVLLVLKDVSIKDFEEHPESLSFLKNCFPNYVEMVSPTQYKSSFDQDLHAVPLSISQMKFYSKRTDVRERIFNLIFNPECPEGCSKEGELKPEAADKFPRTSLLLSTLQMMEEGYPMPVDTKNKLYADYVFSKEKYVPVSASSPLFAIDCEMCRTCEKDFELTRVSVVNEEMEVVYDELVKPHNQITNYLTPYSGMTEERLQPVMKRIEDVHKELRELLPSDVILCGQSLWNDLNALKMFHPCVIDTAVTFNQSGDKKVKCGLRKLAYNFLGRHIQRSKQGHCSVEDAKATMDLVKLKLSKDIEFGDAMLGGVYFPNIKTYFQNPSQAQNVEEMFSTYPVPSLTSLETFPHSQTVSQKSDQKNTPDVETSCEDSESEVMDGKNGLIQVKDSREAERLEVEGSQRAVNRGEKSCKEERERQHAEMDQQQEEVDQQRKDMDQQQEEVNQQRKELDQQQEEVDQQQEGVDRQRKKVDHQRKEMDQQQEEVDQQQEEVDQQRKEMDQQQEEVDQQQEELDRQRKEVDHQRKEMDQQQEEVDQQQEEVDRQRKEMDQREVFFQQEGSTKMFSFFEVFADNKISTGMVGCKDLVSKFRLEPKLQCVEAEDDSDACTKALKVHLEKDFTWVQLNSFAGTTSPKTDSSHASSQLERRKHTLSQLNEQIQQFVTKLQERTLVAVVMTGRYLEGQHMNAATFVKITT